MWNVSGKWNVNLNVGSGGVEWRWYGTEWVDGHDHAMVAKHFCAMQQLAKPLASAIL